MYLKKLMKNAVLLLCSIAMMSAGGEAHGLEIQAKEISFESMDGVCVGNAQNNEGKTGVTVLCFPKGAKTGIDISGGGPASRETPVLEPTREDIGIHAIVLSGGSAYGLAAEVMAKAIEWAITSSQMDDEEYLSYCLDCR